MKCFETFLFRLLLIFSMLSFVLQSSIAQAGVLMDKLTGVVEIVSVEYMDHREDKYQYFLNTRSRAIPIEMIFETFNPDAISSGSKIDVSGNIRDGVFYVDEVDTHINTRFEKRSNSETSSFFSDIEGDAALVVARERKAVALLVNMGSLKSVSNVSAVAGYMYDNKQSMAGQFEASSKGQLLFQRDPDGDGKADVFGPFDIEANVSKSCDYYRWAADAEAAAEAAGIKLEQYQHRVFVLPDAYALKRCGWEGIGNLACGDNCRAWVAGTGSGLYSHELGHNLGMHHAGVDANNDSKADNNYGDVSGVMGDVSHLNLFNAPHHAQMSWFAAYPGSELDVTGKGSNSYNVGALEMDPRTSFPGIQLLTHFRAAGGDYYISFRQEIGNYGVNKKYADKLSIHSFVGGSKMTYFIKSLSVGETFIDSESGFSVTFHGFNGSFADVSIISELGEKRSCVRKAPTLKLSPPLQNGSLFDSFLYTFSVINNDGIYCEGSQFNLSTDTDSALNIYLSRRSLDINPGNSGKVNISVKTDDIRSGGRYEFINSVVSNSHQQSNLTGAVILAAETVKKPEPVALPRPENLVGIKEGSGLRLTWSAPENSFGTLRYYRIFRNGKQVASSRSRYFIDDNLVPGVKYRYYVDVLHTDRSASAPSKTFEYTAPKKRRWWRG